ncbi:hypothetical protein [Streptococcus caecimuris]|uniref:hypothetical protein n=1 Tax=Streptococcus caecimuris TaxID=2941338 RepID=UPI00203E6769|nr:hypothetical protein [Streptococcus caecimuris]
MISKYTDEVFTKIEEIYGVLLPLEFKQVYRDLEQLPNGWYNWADFSRENTDYLKKQMKEVMVEIADEIDDIEWNDNWGECPNTIHDVHHFIKSKMKSALALMPIVGHRYIACKPTAVSPVFSIVGSEIIYYSASLTDFLKGKTITQGTELTVLPQIAFWSEIAQ